jgi:cytochrome c nitrite reductase small subunit
MEERGGPGASPRRRRWSWRLAAGFAVALSLGLAAITMTQGKAFSYFSTRPEACANCHIMQSQYEGWQHSSHRAVATCSDCHIPVGFLSKYLAKAANGWHHSRAFTTGDFAEPIRITPKNAAILEANCRRCHGALVEQMSPGARPAEPCVHCHPSVGHPSPAGIGGPLALPEE